MSVTIKLYDLCAADRAVRFSPPCWSVKFALLHKGVDFETVPLGFSEKENYPDPEYGLLPMIDDGGAVIKDSPVIFNYLDETYVENPLLASDSDDAYLCFYRAFAGAFIFPVLAPLMFLHVSKALDQADHDLFRKTREARLGATLEAASQSADIAALEAALKTLSAPLSDHAFFGGSSANLIDYQVAGVFMWVRNVTQKTLFEKPEALEAWFERILDLFDGYARQSARAAV